MTATLPATRQSTALDTFKTYVRKYPFGVSVAFVVVLSLLARAAFLVHYETNDDVTMQMITSGLVVTDRPDEHVLFSNVLIGLMLKALYTSVPGITWYGIYQFGSVAIAAVACAYALLRVDPTARQAGVTAMLLVVVVLPCLVDLQFTKTAFLASFAGLLLLLAPLRGAAPWPRLADVAGCALLVWGSLVRFESFILALLVMSPVAVAAYRANQMAARWRAVPIVLAGVVAFGLNWFNRDYYAHSEGWENFYAYNAIRADFTDYNRYPYTPASRRAYREAGWDELDYWMFFNWFYPDKDRYSLANLRRIAERAPPVSNNSLVATYLNMLMSLPRFPGLILAILAVPVVGVLTGSGPRRYVMPAVLFGLALVLTGVLGTYFWLPIRVAAALFAGTLIATAFRPRTIERPPAEWTEAPVDRPLGAVAGALGLLLVIATVIVLAVSNARERRLHNDLREVMEAMHPRPDQLFVLWREWFPLEFVVYPFERTDRLRDFRCYSASTLLQTPFGDRRLREFGITNIYLALLDRPGVYLIAMDQLVLLYARYMKLHYDTLVDCRVAFPAQATSPFSDPDDSPKPFFVYQLRRRPLDASTQGTGGSPEPSRGVPSATDSQRPIEK
jgi:hypothetical protein